MLLLHALCLLAPAQDVAAAGSHTVEPYTFVTRDGTTTAAELHALEVPAVRGDAAQGTLTIRWVLIPAQPGGEGPPIVYLAGGPGGSGVEAGRGRRWALVEALRANGDVVLLDQRGAGLSTAHEAFETSVGFDAEDKGDRKTYIERYGKAIDEAVAAWREQGVPLNAYTTAESAADLVDIAKALEAERLGLVGISYGTHLALAVMKAHPEVVDRAVLVSVEGPDDTAKLPSRTDAYFARLQAAIDADPKAKAKHGDVAARIRRVLGRLAEEPKELTVWTGTGFAKRKLGPFIARQAITYAIADPRGAAAMLDGLLAADTDGDHAWFARYAGALLPARIELQPMSTLMDLASGVSAPRLVRIQREARSAILGDALNFPMPHLAGRVTGLELPDAFRAPTRCDRPTLIFSGTLDGRTYPDGAATAASALEEATVVTVTNAGHNLFFSHADIVPTIAAFLAGDDHSGPQELQGAAPNFTRD